MNDKFDAFQKEHEELLPISIRTCEVVKNEIEKLFLDEGISLGFPIQTRVKKWESIFDKVNSGRFNIKKSIKELQDLIGLRVILLFKTDVEKVSKLLSKTFNEVKIHNTIDKLQNNQFGYSSIHIIGRIPQEWTSVPSYKELDNIKFEIQIRTLSQHMWAEVSNTFQYKQEESVPKELLRSIGRASALLEIVDLEFDRLLIERSDYKHEINLSNIETKKLTLNVDILSATLDKALPIQNKDENEDYAGLLKDLNESEINTLEELQLLINENLEKALDEDIKMVESASKPNSNFSINDRIRIRNEGVFFSHEGLVRTMLDIKNPNLIFPEEDEPFDF
ncbi:GTP pyrophosphokinase [Flavobacterium subsaxonicum]|uniref:GTP pyrophosphokinase n=1 Tax=Flavobacterium subsaxonicum TaxID=426226 RepID=UPI000406A927|nr:RelA/SpoT domain-containing protein [Flavobacterium subsaxonicum]